MKLVTHNRLPGSNRLVKRFLLLLLAFVSSVLSAGFIATPVTVTIATRNLIGPWILCTVPIASCNAASPSALIANDYLNFNQVPAFSGVDLIGPVNTGDGIAGPLVQSGYLTFLGLDLLAPDHVVIALRNGFVNVGDPWPFVRPESSIVADLLSQDAAAAARIRSFFLNNLTAFPQVSGTGGTVYRFSAAEVVGTLGPSLVTPEPAAGAMAGTALFALLLWRRRNSR